MDLAFGLPNEKKHEHIYLTTWNLNFSLHSRDTGKSTPNIIFKLFKFQRKLLCYYFLWNFQTEAIIPLEVEDLDLPVLSTCNGIYQNKIVYEIPNICVITIMIQSNSPCTAGKAQHPHESIYKQTIQFLKSVQHLLQIKGGWQSNGSFLK